MIWLGLACFSETVREQRNLIVFPQALYSVSGLAAERVNAILFRRPMIIR